MDVMVGAFEMDAGDDEEAGARRIDLMRGLANGKRPNRFKVGAQSTPMCIGGRSSFYYSIGGLQRRENRGFLG